MYKAIAANKRNTFLIMAVFIGIISAIGWLVSYFFGQPSIALWVFIGAAVYAIIQYFAASKLAVAMSGAQEIQKADNPRLYRMVENLAITLGMPMPKVYIINDPAPNAFATGRNPQHAIVAATTGLLEVMEDNELEAVMAHEMGHVQNYDIRVGMIAFGLVSAIGLLSEMVMHAFFLGDRREGMHPAVMLVGIVIVVLAPIIAVIVQMAVSRQREYLADASGAMTTRDSESLAKALEKLQAYGRPMQHQNTAMAHLFFTNPLRAGFLGRMFSSHPPLEDRIKRLRENAEKF